MPQRSARGKDLGDPSGRADGERREPANVRPPDEPTPDREPPYDEATDAWGE
jgi:hypothetical protein